MVFVGWLDCKIGSEDPVSKEAAVAAAATLGIDYDLHVMRMSSRRMTYLNNVPKTSMLLEEMGPDPLASSMFRCSTSPGTFSRPSLCCAPTRVVCDDSLPVAVGSSVPAAS